MRSVYAERYFFVLAALLLAVMCAVQFGSVRDESITNDEGIHILAGYVYVTTGDYTADPTHPPLVLALAALPLLGLHLPPVAPQKFWTSMRGFLWASPVPIDTILLRARSVVIALTLLFGLWLAWWTRQHFGATTALLALTFFVFDPNLIAHGRYVTTDLIAAFGIFLAASLWTSFLLAPTWTKLSLAAAGLGVALVSKYSAIFLLGVVPLLCAIAWMQKRGQPFFTIRGSLVVAAVMAVGAGLVVALAYAPEIVAHYRYAHSGWIALDFVNRPLASAVDNTTLTGRMLAAMGTAAHLPAYSYLVGMSMLSHHDAVGNIAYLVGKFSNTGWWYYFPVAFLVKTPTAILVACCIALAGLRRRGPPSLRTLCIAIPPLVFFALAMCSSIDLGLRHVLPVYPFLYVLLADALLDRAYRKKWAVAISALILLLAAESLAIYPYYLSFFNWASGGPAHGSRYLLDSNIDWGQDVKRLATYAHAHPEMPMCTKLFGAAPLQYYGVPALIVSATSLPQSNCVLAVSVNPYEGLTAPRSMFDPYRTRTPMARIGYSIYLFDLRH